LSNFIYYLEFGLIDEVLNVQLERLSNLQEQIFQKSQNVQDLNEKMKCLFKNMRAINKLDYWTKLYKSFKESKERDQWYPVPKLENPEQVLREIKNEEIPEGVIQIEIEANEICLSKDLTIKFTFKEREEMIPT
jgi:uncharacterized protein YdiU (UPF0061 family)